MKQKGQSFTVSSFSCLTAYSKVLQSPFQSSCAHYVTEKYNDCIHSNAKPVFFPQISCLNMRGHLKFPHEVPNWTPPNHTALNWTMPSKTGPPSPNVHKRENKAGLS